MNIQELIKRIEKLPFTEGPIADTVTINKEWLLNSLEQLEELKEVEVPQCVAEWYEDHKDNFELNLYRAIDLVPTNYKDGELSEFEEWLIDEHTTPFQTLVTMHQFGYVVSENKKYLVKIKGFEESYNFLNYLKSNDLWLIQSETNNNSYRTHHTRKQLESAGFGWVFNSPGVEIEEVK